MKSSLMKLNHVSTFSGEGQRVMLIQGFPKKGYPLFYLSNRVDKANRFRID